MAGFPRLVMCLAACIMCTASFTVAVGNEEPMRTDTVLQEQTQGLVSVAVGEPHVDRRKHHDSAHDKVADVSLGATILIISFLILVTFTFEFGKHKVEHYVRGTSSEPIVRALFAELTVLGFIAVVVFVINKGGTKSLSYHLYGDEESNGDRLSKNLEDVHMVIFIVMLWFFVQAIFMIVVLEYRTAMWQENQTVVQNKHSRTDIYRKFELLRQDPPKWWKNPYDYWHYWRLQDEVYFALLCLEFIQPRRTISEESNLQTGPKKKKTFDFALYVERVFSHFLQSSLELSEWTWLFLLLEIGLYFGLIRLANGNKHFILLSWIVVAWSIAGACLYLSHRAVATLQQFVPAQESALAIQHYDQTEDIEHKIVQEEQRQQATTSKQQDEEIEEQIKKLRNKLQEVKLAQVRSLPPFLMTEDNMNPIFEMQNISDLEYLSERRKAQKEVFWGLSKQTFSARYSEFSRVALVTSAVIFAVFSSNLFEMAYDMHSAPMATLEVLLSYSASITTLFAVCRLSLSVSLLSAIEAWEDSDIVDEVERVQKERKCLTFLLLIVVMRKGVRADSQAEVDQVNVAAHHLLHEAGAASDQARKSYETQLTKDMSIMFDNLDSSGDGFLSPEEIAKLLRIDPKAKEFEHVKRICSSMECKDHHISKKEFMAWVLVSLDVAANIHVSDFAKSIFSWFDEDESGKIDVTEMSLVLQNILSLTDDHLTPSQLMKLVSSIDNDRDGEFDIGELTRWIRAHEKDFKMRTRNQAAKLNI